MRTNLHLSLTILLVASVLETLHAATADTQRFCVRDFGADGSHYKRNTLAFQRAIDECSKRGGGVVEVPKGTYELGRVHLKANVTLRLATGAILTPTKNLEAFPALRGDPRSFFRRESGESSTTCRYSLLYAYRANNLTIEGSGKIVGDGKAFWDRRNTGDFPKWKTWAPAFYYKARKGRPFLIMLEQCENVRIRDITLEDAPVYGALFAGCRGMQLQNVTVRNDLAGPNTDGFHFSSCRDVRITGCDFTCGDDCIAIDGNYMGLSSNFTISECHFSTTVNAFRIFTGLSHFLPKERPRERVSDICASNCTVRDASGVFNIVADGGDIERLSFSNFTVNMEQRGCALFLLTLRGGRIQNIIFNHMAIRTDGIGTISGEGGGRIRNVLLDGLLYEAVPRTKLYGNGLPEPIPAYSAAHYAPYNLFVRHAQNLKLRNLTVEWQQGDLADLHQVPHATNTWSCIQCRNVQGLDIEGVVCAQFGTASPAILLEDVQDARITQCRAMEGTGVFLRLKGRSKNIRFLDNDLTKAATPYQTDNPSSIAPSHSRDGISQER